MTSSSAGGTGHTLRFRYDAIEPPRRLVLTEPGTGITTEIRLEPSGEGTTVVIRQRRLPPELRTEDARAGMAGVLARLDQLARGLS